MSILGIIPHGFDDTHSSLGNEYLLTDSGSLISVGAAAGSTHTTNSPGSSQTTAQGPTSTLVDVNGVYSGTGPVPAGLKINLIWDSSVRTAANWQAIEQSVIAAAEVYTSTMSSNITLNIQVGFGEIDGSKMGSGDLGESDSYGYITNYATVNKDLTIADSDLTTHGLMSADALTADKPPTTGNFFVTSAEAKALGLISGSSTGVDGYIGLSSSSSLMYFGTGTQTASQYDAVGVATHEISEVMGRIGMQGETLSPYHNVYTPLDLFRYTSAGVRDTTPAAGYFSTFDGFSNLLHSASGGPNDSNTYNNPSNGGDADDWASASGPGGGITIGHTKYYVPNDAYDAFGTPGVTTTVSATDLLQDAALGYTLNSTGINDITTNHTIVT